MNAPRKSRTIMLVEDDADTRELYAAAFDQEGYEVVALATAEDALRTLRAGQTIDVLVTDYNLPLYSGASLIYQARNERLIDDVLPVILCTGYTFVNAPPRVLVVHKPVEPLALLRTLEQAFKDSKKEAAANKAANDADGQRARGERVSVAAGEN